MTSTLKLHGIVPPVATPYDHDGQIDPQGLRAVLRHLIDGGVHGLFVLGSTSECVFLNPAQRGLVIETAVKEAAGRVPVLVGVMDATTDHCIAHGRQAQALGAQALVLTAPYYTRTNQAETLDHFRYVRDAVDLPVVAYDIPVCVNIKLARDTVNTLARLRRELGPSLPLVFIIGTDQLASLDTWRDWQRLFESTHIAVAGRPGHPVDSERLSAPLAAALAEREAATVGTQAAGRIIRFAMAPLDVAATAIRAALAQNQTPGTQLPAPVLSYIQSHALYRNTHR